MATREQVLLFFRLPQEILNLILKHVLHSIFIMVHETEHFHDTLFDKVRAGNHCLRDLNRKLALLKIKPPNRDMLLRHATFTFSRLAYGAAVHHLSVTREQFEGLRMSIFESFEALQTFTVRETMRAGANSSTKLSVRYRLKADFLMRQIAGLDDECFDALGHEQLLLLIIVREKCRLILKLTIETWMPDPQTYCEAIISDGEFLHFDAKTDEEEWKRVLTNGLCPDAVSMSKERSIEKRQKSLEWLAEYRRRLWKPSDNPS